MFKRRLLAIQYEVPEMMVTAQSSIRMYLILFDERINCNYFQFVRVCVRRIHKQVLAILCNSGYEDR